MKKIIVLGILTLMLAPLSAQKHYERKYENSNQLTPTAKSPRKVPTTTAPKPAPGRSTMRTAAVWQKNATPTAHRAPGTATVTSRAR